MLIFLIMLIKRTTVDASQHVLILVIVAVLLIQLAGQGLCKKPSLKSEKPQSRAIKNQYQQQKNKRKASSTMLMLESGTHLYPQSTFLRNYKSKKNQSEEFKLIRKYFPKTTTTINMRRYDRFLREFLLSNMFDNDEMPQTGMHELVNRYRVKMMVSAYLAEVKQQKFGFLDDVYCDLYRGDIFEWILQQSDDL